MWVPDISGFGGPRYLALSSAIAEAINSGDLPAGAQLPPQRYLAEKLGVTVGTVGRAYLVAKKRGLVSGEVGRGTFVLDRMDGSSSVGSFLPEQTPGTIDLVCFRIAGRDLADPISEAVANISGQAPLLRLKNYPPAAGYVSHRTAGAAWIKRSGLDVPADRIIVCAGGQQAILASVLALASSGGPILTEEMTYSGMKSIAALRDVELEGIAMDDEGMCPDALSQAAERSGAKIVYVQPTIHNPIGFSMSAERRKRIAEVAQQHDLILIEDDVVAAGIVDRDPPIAAIVPERTIYITSLSKCVCPSLRAGFMAVPPALVNQLSTVLHSMSLATSTFALEVASTLILNGSAHTLARRNAEDLAERHEIARRELSGLGMRSNPEAYYVWLDLPAHWTTSEFADAVLQSGVSIVRTENFSVARNAHHQAVRISLNPGSDLDVLTEGLRHIKRVFVTHPMPNLSVI